MAPLRKPAAPAVLDTICRQAEAQRRHWLAHALICASPMNFSQLAAQRSQRFAHAVATSALCGDPRKARRVLGWAAAMPLDEICRLMVEADLKRREAEERRAGETQ